MEKDSNKKGNILVILVVAIIAASLGALGTYFIMSNKTTGDPNVLKGTKWYSAYAGKVTSWDFKEDGDFEYNYNNNTVTGTYTAAAEVVTLAAEGYSEEQLIYSKKGKTLTLSGETYYDSEKEANKNDAYLYIPADYDTSMFKTLTADELVKKFNNGDTMFVLWARGSCGYCQKFRPIAADSLKKYNYTLYYVNVATLKDEDYETIAALDNSFSENISSTPNVFYISKKAVKDMSNGYVDAEGYGEFLVKNGVKEK